MHLIKRYMKRIIPVITVFVILLGCFVSPVAASETSQSYNTGLLHYDLLTENVYKFRLYKSADPSNPFYESDTYSPFYTVSSSEDVRRVSTLWTPYNSGRAFSTIVIAIVATQQPTDFFLYHNDGLRKGVYQGAQFLFGQKDLRIFYYSFDVNTYINSIGFNAQFSSDYSGIFGYYSCVGLLDTSVSLSKVDIYRDDLYFEDDGIFRETATALKGRSIPYVFSSYGDYDYYAQSVFRIVINTFDFVSPLVNNLSILVATSNSSVATSVSLISLRDNGSDITDVQHNLFPVSDWAYSGDYYEEEGIADNYSTYQLDVDLSGYDMNDYYIMVTIGVTVDSIEDQYIDFNLRSILYSPYVEDVSWTESFFGSWFNTIRNSISNVGTFIQNLSSSVGSYFTQLFNKLDNYFNSVGTFFYQLFHKLDDYFGNDGSLAQAGDEMAQQADQMQQANDSMNAVEKPSLDTGQLFGDYLNFDNVGLILLSSMTNNAYVTQCLVVVFTFALCGYVFFGKRR